MKKLVLFFLLITLYNSAHSQSSEFELFNTGFIGAVTALTEDTSGNVWGAIGFQYASPDTSVLVLIGNDVLDTLYIPTSYPIWGIDLDQQNNLWIATQDTGLIKYDGLAIEYFNMRQIITRTPYHNNANCVQVDKENNVWVGAIGGLAKYDGNDWTVYDDLNSPLQFLPDIYSIKFDDQNNLWFGGYYGAGRFDGNNWTLWSAPNFEYINTVSIAKNGSVWFGPYWGSYTELVNDSSWIEFDSILALPSSNYQIAVDTNNIKWLGQYGGEPILAYNDSYFISLDISEFAMSSLKSIYVDRKNNKWFGFDGGYILKYSGDFPTSVEDGNEDIPLHFSLSQNYPNPFNPVTTIKYSIPSVTMSGDEGSRITLKVYDVLGKEVATLVDEHKPAGMYKVQFTMNNLASGVYFYKLQAGSYVQTKKMILLK